MSYQTIFKRYELKYIITKEEQRKLYEKITDYMEPDKFGKSTINNIYFDTPNKLLIRRSLDKPEYKEKLRVRSYGVATEDSIVFIELKKKYNGIVYKRRIDMSEKMATDYLINHVPVRKSSQITKEIDYFMQFYENLEPSVVLSYEREAFLSKTDPNFRMTFDENILSREYDLSLRNGVYGENILKKGMVLLEVKTAFGLPKWILDFLSKNEIYKTSFSKYGRAYNQMIEKQVGGKIDVA